MCRKNTTASLKDSLSKRKKKKETQKVRANSCVQLKPEHGAM